MEYGEYIHVYVELYFKNILTNFSHKLILRI